MAVRRSGILGITESIVRERRDITHAFFRTTEEEPMGDFDGGPHYFDEECIFDPVDDDLARWLLKEWLDGCGDVGWNINKEMSKFLAKRGHPVRDRVEPIIRALCEHGLLGGEWTWGRDQLLLSFLINMSDGEDLAIRALDRAPEDFRDGLFFASYRLNTPAIYEAMKGHVREWAKEIWCSGTAEQGLVRRMVDRWDVTFPAGDHEDIRRICDECCR
jgi:hypothetical protein